MSKQEDPLAAEIRYELMPGRYVRWDDVSRLVHNLERVHEKVEALLKAGEAERAVRLFEIFMSGVYNKIEEADDECDLAMLFHRLTCGWIQARQAAGRSAEETFSHLLKWMKNDDYGFCNDIERDVIKVLDTEGQRLFIDYFRVPLEKITAESAIGTAHAISKSQNDMRTQAESLKAIYESLGDAGLYEAICEKSGFSSCDCECLAKMAMSRKHWAKALEWVEKGLSLTSKSTGYDGAAFSLEHLKPELLRHLGRKTDALALAWGEFQKSPNAYSYEHLMKYVPKGEKSSWQERIMTAADKTDLGNFIDLCVEAREWERLARRIHSTKPSELEALSHYTSEPAASGLAKRDALAAAKLYRAMGLRIVNAGKSKYYKEALEHFEKTRDLFCELGLASEWEALVQAVHMAHSRKSGFLSEFKRIVAGKSLRA